MNAPAGSASETDRHSSVADRYRPSNYEQTNRNVSPGYYDNYDRNVSPIAQQNRGSPNPAYPSALAVRPSAGYDQYSDYSNPGYNTYQPPYDEDDEPRRRHRPSRSRSSQSNRRSRSRSRIRDTADKAKDGFERHKKELGVGALGAIAGGIIGNEFGGKKGSMGMIIGAALGGLGVQPGASTRSADARRVRELEKELRRKDKALAETAALLVLQKKVHAIWGDEDDDTKPGSDE